MWARRKRSVAGSRATTEGLFEAFAFDVCPTTQRDLFLWAAGSALMCGKHHFSAALSFPITFKLQLTTNFAFFFFDIASKSLATRKEWMSNAVYSNAVLQRLVIFKGVKERNRTCFWVYWLVTFNSYTHNKND